LKFVWDLVMTTRAVAPCDLTSDCLHWDSRLVQLNILSKLAGTRGRTSPFVVMHWFKWSDWETNRLLLNAALSSIPCNEGQDVTVHAFLLSLGIRYKWASRYGHSIPGKRTLGTHWIRGWLGEPQNRSGRGVEHENSFSSRDSKPGRPVHRYIILTELSGFESRDGYCLISLIFSPQFFSVPPDKL
jgi:hypothetical protein